MNNVERKIHKVAVVYHSAYGHTERQAKAIAAGAVMAGVSATLHSVLSLGQNLDELEDADAIIFGSPTYMGSVSAAFKAFMDDSSKVWLRRAWQDKIAAGFTNSQNLSGDKLNTLIQMAIFASQHGMIWVGQSELSKSTSAGVDAVDSINRMGVSLGAVAQSDNSAPELTPPKGDLLTAEKLGQRVATIVKKFHRLT